MFDFYLGINLLRFFQFKSIFGPERKLNIYFRTLTNSCNDIIFLRWVIFNDRKVALSEKPPKELGYLYLYKRVDS